MENYIIKDLNPNKNLIQLQSFIFGLLDCKTHSEFSNKLCKLHNKNPKIAGELQDKIMNSRLFLQLTDDGSYNKLAANILKTSIDDVKTIFPFFGLIYLQNLIWTLKKCHYLGTKKLDII